MSNPRLHTPGLRTQALLISFSLSCLVTLLGTKAYSVARSHFEELNELATHDLKAQGLLVRMEGLASQRDQARRKFRITHDLQYQDLSTHYDELLRESSTQLQDELASSEPELIFHGTADGVRRLRAQFDSRREEKLAHSHAEALGLLRLIGLALVLSGVITAWLLTLFYRGLLKPLRRLEDATSRIRGGDLSFRLRADRGVSELRELADSFDQMAERLEHLDAAKKEFLTTVSHEIKNPLAALKEGMNLLSAQGETMLPRARARAYSACLIASKRLESMINNLLHHSRMEMGLFDFDLTPKDLSAAVHIAMEEVRPLAQKKNMAIEYRGDTEILAPFNWDGMVQVFENLLLNAIKYGHEGSIIEVHARTTQRQIESTELPHLELAVVNDGARLAEEDLSQVFDRFYRGSNSTLQQGMGLGLHVVRKIVEAHHGGITAESNAGKTRFQLWIPGRYETEAG